MIDNMFSCDVAKEFLTVLSYCDDSYLKRIPDYILKRIKDLSSDSLKSFFVDTNKSLEEQNISEECKDMISIIYMMYVADSLEKETLFKIWLENEKNTIA